METGPTLPRKRNNKKLLLGKLLLQIFDRQLSIAKIHQSFTSAECEGVSWRGTNHQWSGWMYSEGKKVCLGSFPTERETIQRYKTADIERALVQEIMAETQEALRKAA